MILGRIKGKLTTTNFCFITESVAKKFEFLQVRHSEYGFVLCQIYELERDLDSTIAKCKVIGFRDRNGRIQVPRTPFQPGTEVLLAQDSFIQQIIEINTRTGAFLGNLDGKNIPVHVDLNKLLTKHVAVLAKSGSGKSYAIGVLVEEIMDKNIPLLIIDPHGEYGSLAKANEEERDNLTKFGLEPKAYPQIVEYGDYSLDPSLHALKLNQEVSAKELFHLLPTSLTSAQESLLYTLIRDMSKITLDNIKFSLQELNSQIKWGLIDVISYLTSLGVFSDHPTPLNQIIKPGVASILNLKGVAPELQEVFVYKLLKDLFEARKRGKIPPFFCVVEEAHNFAPERTFGKAKSGDVLRLIASEGRKFGLGLAVISQRPARVDKSVLSQCSTQIILKVSNPNDVKAISNSVEGLTLDAENEINSLPIGTAMICGVVDLPLFVNIRPRKSKHGGDAIDIFAVTQAEKVPDLLEEVNDFENRMPLIIPKTTKEDLRIMALRPVKRIQTYLIPALYLVCEEGLEEYALLVDKIKGNIILNAEREEYLPIHQASSVCAFLQKLEFRDFVFDVQLDERLTDAEILQKVPVHITVKDKRPCFIVHYHLEH